MIFQKVFLISEFQKRSLTHYGMQTYSPKVENINNKEIYKNQGIGTQFPQIAQTLIFFSYMGALRLSLGH